MKCNFCKQDFNKPTLSFNNLFSKSNLDVCPECLDNLAIKNCVVSDKFTLFYFADYEFLKDTIYDIKYFGNTICANNFKFLFKDFFSKNNFDIITVAPSNYTREAIRGFNHVELICEFCNVNYTALFDRKYREKQSQLHKKRELHDVKVLDNCYEKIKCAKTILIVDDVFTSGKTLISLATALLEINSELEITFLTLARS